MCKISLIFYRLYNLKIKASKTSDDNTTLSYIEKHLAPHLIFKNLLTLNIYYTQDKNFYICRKYDPEKNTTKENQFVLWYNAKPIITNHTEFKKTIDMVVQKTDLSKNSITNFKLLRKDDQILKSLGDSTTFYHNYISGNFIYSFRELLPENKEEINNTLIKFIVFNYKTFFTTCTIAKTIIRRYLKTNPTIVWGHYPCYRFYTIFHLQIYMIDRETPTTYADRLDKYTNSLAIRQINWKYIY